LKDIKHSRRYIKPETGWTSLVEAGINRAARGDISLDKAPVRLVGQEKELTNLVCSLSLIRIEQDS
jgi:hypothetical protein